MGIEWQGIVGMTKFEIQLALCIAGKIKDDASLYSYDTMRTCYYEMLEKNNIKQEAKLTEMWVEYTWSQMKSISPRKLLELRNDKDKLHHYLAEFMKD